MANLERLETEERELLVSLPYRIGCFISDADDEEGSHDDEQEEAALEEVLALLASGEKGTQFTTEIASETVRRKGDWESWKFKIFDIPEDCKKAIQIIEQKLGKTKAKNFRSAMMVVARSVAKAADEFDDFNPEEEEESGIGAFVGKLVRKVKPDANREKAHIANISAAEQAQLDQLARALHVEE